MVREQKFALFLAVALIGSMGIGLSTILVVGRIHHTAPSTTRIIAGTLIVMFSMIWGCYFATRAHFARDEYKRQRAVSAAYWGGWLGIGASAPVFFFIAAGGFGPLAAMHAPPALIFDAGYVLPVIFGAIGNIGARLWLRYRDS